MDSLANFERLWKSGLNYVLLSLGVGGEHSYLDSDRSSCEDITEQVALVKGNPSRKHPSPEESVCVSVAAGS